MKTGYIYGLINPRKPEHIKYIGKTVRKLELRLTAHLQEAKTKNNKRTSWINHLRKQNIKPKIIVIEIIKIDLLNEREIYWISYYRKMNQADKNTLDGGDGFTSISSKNVQFKRAINKGQMTSEEKKKALLNLPENSNRPSNKSILGIVLSHYIKTNDKTYDEDFKKK